MLLLELEVLSYATETRIGSKCAKEGNSSGAKLLAAGAKGPVAGSLETPSGTVDGGSVSI